MTDPDEDVVVIDASLLVRPDLSMIDALARLELDARRQGRRIVVRAPGEPLRELLALAGLTGVVATCPDEPGVPHRPDMSVELQRQAEHREQPRAEEVRDVGDQPA